MKDEIAIQSKQGFWAVAGAAASALTLNQWVMIATFVYIVLQGAYLLRKWYREERDWTPAKRRRQ